MQAAPAAMPQAELQATPKGDAEQAAARTTAETPPSSKPAEVAQPPAPQPVRLAILTPGGPLLMDATITLDGRPLGAQFEKRIDEALAAADADHDGRSTWQELLDNEAFLSGPLANAEGAGAQQKKTWIEQYDLNRDDVFQRTEAAAWLARDGRTGADPLALRSSRSFQADPRSSSRLWRLVDADDSGQLSASEIQSATAALLALDADDNRLITPAELVPLDELLAAQNGPAARSDAADRYAAIQLEAGGDLARVEYLLNDLYAPRQDLGADSFPAFPQLFAALDSNHDQWLQRRELDALSTVPAALALSVDFGGQDDAQSGTAALRVDASGSETSVRAPAGNRVVLSTMGVRLAISANDLGAGEGSPRPVDRSQIRVMVHDQGDSVYNQLDANADGRLGEREIAAAPQRLLECDADGDGELAGNELPYWMTAAFLRGESPGEESFYVPWSPTARTMQTPAPEWFIDADFNRDGEISRGEFLGTAAQFTDIDRSQDGFIDAAEATALDAK
jgi:hypothetical protein